MNYIIRINIIDSKSYSSVKHLDFRQNASAWDDSASASHASSGRAGHDWQVRTGFGSQTVGYRFLIAWRSPQSWPIRTIQTPTCAAETLFLGAHYWRVCCRSNFRVIAVRSGGENAKGSSKRPFSLLYGLFRKKSLKLQVKISSVTVLILFDKRSWSARSWEWKIRLLFEHAGRHYTHHRTKTMAPCTEC